MSRRQSENNMDKLRIVVGEDDAVFAMFLKNSLERLGHQLTGQADNGTDLVALCDSTRPDLLITDFKLRGLNGLDAISLFAEQVDLPVILISSFHSDSIVQRALNSKVSAYLVKPIEVSDLAAAIPIVMERFREMKAARDENLRLTQALQDRKIIERAKGILMAHTQSSEAEAFNRLRRLARDRRQSLAEIANSIIISEEVMAAGS